MSETSTPIEQNSPAVNAMLVMTTTLLPHADPDQLKKICNVLMPEDSSNVENVEAVERKRAAPRKDPNSLYRRVKTVLDLAGKNGLMPDEILNTLKNNSLLRSSEDVRSIKKELARQKGNAFVELPSGKWILKKYQAPISIVAA